MLNKEIPRTWELGDVNTVLLAPTTTIYQGAAVGDNGVGLARPLKAGDTFLGFCEQTVSNLTPPGMPLFTSPSTVNVLTRGRVQLTVAGVKANHMGALVYAVDDESFTLSGYPNSPMGTVYRVISEGLAIVAFGQSQRPNSHTLMTAGSHKTTGGGPLEKIPLPGLLPSDLLQVNLASVGKTPCKIVYSNVTGSGIQVMFDGDPGTDHLIQYGIYRAGV